MLNPTFQNDVMFVHIQYLYTYHIKNIRSQHYLVICILLSMLSYENFLYRFIATDLHEKQSDNERTALAIADFSIMKRICLTTSVSYHFNDVGTICVTSVLSSVIYRLWTLHYNCTPSVTVNLATSTFIPLRWVGTVKTLSFYNRSVQFVILLYASTEIRTVNNRLEITLECRSGQKTLIQTVYVLTFPRLRVQWTQVQHASARSSAILVNKEAWLVQRQTYFVSV